MWGDVPLVKINTLRTVAAEMPTLKVVFSCTDQQVLSRIDRDVHCLFLKSGENGVIFVIFFREGIAIVALLL